MRLIPVRILLVATAVAVSAACTNSPSVPSTAPTESPPASSVPPQAEASCTTTPSLVGEVFVVTEGGTRRPAAKLWVGFHAEGVRYWGDNPWPASVTDAHGRYAFCGVPLGPALVAAGNCNDALEPVSVEIGLGENRQDIDVSWLLSCPGWTGL